MAEGTAFTMKMKPKEAATSMMAIEKTKTKKVKKKTVWKAGDYVLTIPVGMNEYLMVVIPKSAVDEKVGELNKSNLDASTKAAALTSWVKKNRDAAVEEYQKTGKSKFKFDIKVEKMKLAAKPKKADVSAMEMALKLGIKEKKIKAPDSMKIGSTKGPSSYSGKKATESIKKNDYVVTTKWVETSKTFKNLGQVLGHYYGKKGFGSGAAYSFDSVPIVWEIEGKTTKLNFFIIITTSDFGDVDIKNITKKQKEKAINTITDNLLKNIAEAFKKKGIKLSKDAIKESFKNVVTGLVGNIAKEKKKVIKLK